MIPDSEARWRFLVGSAGSYNFAGWARALLWSGGHVSRAAALIRRALRSRRQTGTVDHRPRGRLVVRGARFKSGTGGAIAVGSLGGGVASYAKVPLSVGSAPPLG